MKAQPTHPNTTRRMVLAAAHLLFDVVAIAFGAALVISGLAIAGAVAATDRLMLLTYIAVPAGLLVLGSGFAVHVASRGLRWTATATWRVLISGAALLALLGIAAAAPSPVPTWRQDVMAWQTLGVLTLTLGLIELTGLLDLPRTRQSWKRELIGLQVLLAWAPFAWLLVFYPNPPVWAGHRDGLHQVKPLLQFLLVLSVVFLGQILIGRHWRALQRWEQTAAATTAAVGVEPLPDVVPVRVWLLEDGDEAVGVQLGLLPQIHGDWIRTDLAAALWLMPAGVVVRVGYTNPNHQHYLVEGSITGCRDGGVVLDGWWIGGDDIALTGLEILADDRSALSCEQSRTPALLTPLSTGQPDPAPLSATAPGGVSLQVSSGVSGRDSGPDSPRVSAGDTGGDSARPESGQRPRTGARVLPTHAIDGRTNREILLRNSLADHGSGAQVLIFDPKETSLLTD